MAGSTRAAIKGALLTAVWIVLLHSLMAQPPPSPAPASSPSPPLDCGNCTSKCTTTSQGVYDYEAGLCNTTSAPGVVYHGCLESCANSTCNGHSYAKHGGCTMGACTPDHCGNPCVQRCCGSCTATAHASYDNCMASAASKAWQECMPGCMHNCRAYYGCAING
ncbi:hypothetical protein PVAP13_4KG111430 [Panicum virgatum]|uniref:Uncharacterized protein n=1 Tax=Panicum virgatum TaxID=38727 RepID=A0A8T0TSK0_PANVG|nr:hypothetical protein PVAP13_4KG111425 [Panicum virgatum]KAG2611775.1 hypothetical protein PVAP13_4KG111430 [Panicum virgatum]